MIPNQVPDSSQAGYVQPSAQPEYPILDGQSLEDFLQQFIAGVSGLDGTLVRPRWQPEPPNIPDFATTWAACGINRRQPLGYLGAVLHNSADPGSDITIRHEQIELMISFYGPEADSYAENFHCGMMVWQNYAVLRIVGMAFVDVGESVRAPEMIKNRWLDRIDKMLTINRAIVRQYPILNLLSASASVLTDTGYEVPVTVVPPP